MQQLFSVNVHVTEQLWLPCWSCSDLFFSQKSELLETVTHPQQWWSRRIRGSRFFFFVFTEDHLVGSTSFEESIKVTVSHSLCKVWAAPPTRKASSILKAGTDWLTFLSPTKLLINLHGCDVLANTQIQPWATIRRKFPHGRKPHPVWEHWATCKRREEEVRRWRSRMKQERGRGGEGWGCRGGAGGGGVDVGVSSTSDRADRLPFASASASSCTSSSRRKCVHAAAGSSNGLTRPTRRWPA